MIISVTTAGSIIQTDPGRWAQINLSQPVSFTGASGFMLGSVAHN